MVDLTRVTAGLIGSAQLVVGPEHTAPFVGSGRIAVLATPVMINVIEAAALEAIEHLLPAGHQSLGIHLDVATSRQRRSACRSRQPRRLYACKAAPSPSASKPATRSRRSAAAPTSASWSASHASTNAYNARCAAMADGLQTRKRYRRERPRNQPIRNRTMATTAVMAARLI